ncbi:Protein of unknown function [Lentibacillus persicus]|uniref:DNA-binding ferritin-like protein (Dps family) n=1 Tax=Lentibacillus persicus TaxID=640948 RepID=A0A1I1ZT74_9BACI|nr:DUF1129 family protein [Lentibacillus persicus]SFE34847.1 Protein of unknown function [Lentibacillus persicus]
MNTKDLIQLNNEKREQLTKENKQYYGDMLVYIRTNFTKSERYIEEVLMELLDHLLQAQANGRTAKDVFGDDPKAYCNDIVGEIPSEKKANRLSFIFYLVMNLGGLVSLTAGTVGLVLFFIFGLGEGTIAFPLGSGILVILIDLILLLLFVMAILKWVKNSTFKEKQPRKWVEFLLLWASTALFIGLSLLVPRFMPDIGHVIQISFPVFILTGAVMYISSVVMNKKMQLVK